MRTFAIPAILFLGAFSAGAAAGTSYHVSPSGSDQNDGKSAEKPFQTVSKAAQAAAAGDVVNILPGTYEGRIRPANSGTQEAPITYRRDGNGEVVITTRKETDGGPWEERFAFQLGEGRHYTVLEGLTFRDAEAWVYIGDGARHNTIRNCVFDGCRMYHGIYVNSGSFNTIAGCRFLRALPYPEGWDGTGAEPKNMADYIALWCDSHYNLVTDCEFGEITHVAVSIMGHDPAYRARFNIIRNCTFREPKWKCVSAHGSEHTLVENNVMSGLAATFFQFQARGIIFRRNVLRDYRAVRTTTTPPEYHGAVLLRSIVDEYGNLDDVRLGRIYHNTFYNCQKATAYGPRATSLPVCENVFKNNIFYKTGEPLRLPRPFYASHTTQNANYLVHNAILGAKAGEKVLELVAMDKRETFTLAEAAARSGELCKRQLYEGNLEVDPQFVSEEARDLRLRPGSPCIDAGAPLTRAAEGASGDEIVVEDPHYFCDGWQRIEGDEVVIGKNLPVRILKVDYERRSLKLSAKVQCAKGDAVSLSYQGAGPDIGAFEFQPPTPKP